MKTFQTIMADYENQYTRRVEGFKKDKTSNIPINYGQLEQDICEVLESKGFTVKQAAYLSAYLYQEYHSSYGDVIAHAQDICDLFKDFPKD